ncbi:MAG TPA: hypothetical protein VN326_16300 [Casimicrobiaceae bacterium]|nr:hypothetical protein [Casimicrobiaceae bacterium]
MSPKSVRLDVANPAPLADAGDALARGFLVAERWAAVGLVDDFLAMICAPVK